jgi:hypothetical protein
VRCVRCVCAVCVCVCGVCVCVCGVCVCVCVCVGGVSGGGSGRHRAARRTAEVQPHASAITHFTHFT